MTESSLSSDEKSHNSITPIAPSLGPSNPRDFFARLYESDDTPSSSSHQAKKEQDQQSIQLKLVTENEVIDTSSGMSLGRVDGSPEGYFHGPPSLDASLVARHLLVSRLQSWGLLGSFPEFGLPLPPAFTNFCKYHTISHLNRIRLVGG